MIRALHTAATGMDAQQQRIDIIANNLANVNTTGFKKSRADFQDLLYQQVRAPGTSAAQGVNVPSGLQIGTGVRTAATHRTFSTGDLQQTGNQFDLAIEGNGFFQVTMPDGTPALHPVGELRARWSGPDRHAGRPPARPRHHDPAGCHFGDGGRGRDGLRHPRRRDGSDGSRADPAGQLRQPRWVDGGRPQLPRTHHGQRRAADRPARHRGRGHDFPGFHRNVQRQGGRRDDRPDREPACLRDQLQGHPGQ